MKGQALNFSPDIFAKYRSVSSSSHEIIYTLAKALEEQDGLIFHIDSPGLDILEFTHFDIENYKIMYIPPMNDHNQEENIVSFKFTGLVHIFLLY